MKFDTINFYIFITILITITPFSICHASLEPRIAIILPESGKFSERGKEMKASFNIAVEEKFEKLISTIQLIYFDNYSTADSARNIALDIARNPDYIGMVAGYPSSCAYQIMLVAEEFQIPYLIVSSSAGSLTNRQLEFTFRMAPLSTDYNDGLVSWAATNIREGRLISVIHHSENYSVDAVEDIRYDLQRRWRGKVEISQFDRTQEKINELIANQAKLKPDLIWLICSTADAALFLKGCRDNDWSPMAFVFGTVNMVNSRIVSLADGTADYVFGPSLWSVDEPYPKIKQFSDSYFKNTGESPSHHAAESFAGIEVLTAALLKCVSISRESLRHQLAATNILTVFGKVRFDNFRGFRNQNRSRSVCMQLLDQEWKSVWPREIARSRYVYPTPDWRERRRNSNEVNASPILYFLFVVLTILLLIMTFKRGKKLKRKIGL